MRRFSKAQRLHVHFAAVVAAIAILLPAATAIAQPVNSNQARIAALDLDTLRFDGAIVFHSNGAAEPALFYGAEAEAAAAWYRERLDWAEPIEMAVLDEADFSRTTRVAYPSPHAETATGFIVIADHVDSHPGFDLWDIDERAINAAWLFHEIGHVIAADLGIASANLWVNELIASVFMAAYVRAERPQFAGFQSGMPPRFADEGNYATLAEFDRLYFAMGQFDYLWFHFHIAELADYVVMATGGLSAAVDGLKREFPIGRPPETVAATLARLERIAPGINALAALLVQTGD